MKFHIFRHLNPRVDLETAAEFVAMAAAAGVRDLMWQERCQRQQACLCGPIYIFSKIFERSTPSIIDDQVIQVHKCMLIFFSTHNLLDHFFHDSPVLQVVKVTGGRRASNEPQLSYVAGLIGFGGDADGEESHALALGGGDSRKYVWVPRVGDAIKEQNGDLAAADGRLFQVNTGEVGDGVRGVGAVADVDHGGDPGFEIIGAPPLAEGLLDDDMAAVLKEGGAGDQAPARLQPQALQPVHHVSGKALLLSMVVLGALRAVDQKGQLQTAIFCPKD